MAGTKTMSSYEARAWEALQRELEKRIEAKSRVPEWARKAITRGKEKATSAFEHVPLNDEMERAFLAALRGLKLGTIDPAMRSVRRTAVISDYRAQGHIVDAFAEIRDLDLSIVDAVKPALRTFYSVALAAEGAATGAVITGGGLLFTAGTVAGGGVAGGPGAAAVIGAMAADAAAILAGCGRIVAHIGAYYGYDTNIPEEELFALSAMNFSLSDAGTEGTRIYAFSQLSVITQQLIRRKTWDTLNESVIVRVITKVFERLGLRVTQKKLGQVVPVLGIALGAGMNVHIIHKIASDAEFAYRLRFLAERGGLELDDLLNGSPTGGAPSNSAEVDIMSLVDEPQDQASAGSSED